MADEIIKDELPKDAPAYAYDLDLLMFKQYKQMQNAKFYDVYNYIEPIITRWNCKIPLGEGAMNQLEVADSAGMFTAIMSAFNDDVEKLVPLVKVDFSLKGWTMLTIKELVTAESAGKWDKVAELMLGIVRFPDVKRQPTIDTLKAVQGEAAFKAIMEKWQKVLQGKN